MSDSSADSSSSEATPEEESSEDSGEDQPFSTGDSQPLHNAYAALRAMLGGDRADAPND